MKTHPISVKIAHNQIDNLLDDLIDSLKEQQFQLDALGVALEAYMKASEGIIKEMLDEGRNDK